MRGGRLKNTVLRAIIYEKKQSCVLCHAKSCGAISYFGYRKTGGREDDSQKADRK